MSTQNSGSVFYNKNECRSFTQSLSTRLVALSAQSCSEVLFINKSGQQVYVYDNNYFSDLNRLMLDNNESITLRGLTNCNSVSAKTALSGGNVYFRTQNYSVNTY